MNPVGSYKQDGSEQRKIWARWEVTIESKQEPRRLN